MPFWVTHYVLIHVVVYEVYNNNCNIFIEIIVTKYV